MADYIYETQIIFDTSKAIGYDNSQEAANTSDYENNHQSQTVKVNDLMVATTSFEINKSYSDFKSLIDGIFIHWSDVKEVKNGIKYKLYLVVQSLL